MKIIIDIPEDLYNMTRTPNNVNYIMRMAGFICSAIANGTPLPKGHGRLIDADDIENHIVGSVDTRDCPTIIEADTTRDCKTCGHSNSGKCAYTEECHECMWVNKYIEAGGGEE